MIYTVTLNPALDRAVTVPGLSTDDTVRVLEECLYAAGKGIDVSRVVHELGGRSVALGLVGGYNGLTLEGLLINAGVLIRFTRIAGETRTNIVLKEASSGREYVIAASGPEIQASEIGELYHTILSIEDMEYLVLSGSLPRGVSPNLYGQLILAGREKKSFVVLDTDNRALKEAVAFQPSLIKPNLFELSRLVGRALETEADILAALGDLHEQGLAWVLVSMGRRGMILSGPGTRLKAEPPPVQVDSTVGAGDSAVAGFVLAHAQGKEPAECLRLACAAGTAAAQTPGTELCHRDEVERLLPLIRLTTLDPSSKEA
jgi:6-phosphofructokinase 2